MKIVYNKTGVLLITGFLFFSGCGNNKNRGDNQEKQSVDSAQTNSSEVDAKFYSELRNKALGTTSEQFEMMSLSEPSKIYGVIMDWDIGDGTATLVSFISGDASLYFSSGDGTIGEDGNENIKHAAKEFVTKAGNYLSKAVKTDATPLPGKGIVKFYFLTTDGKFVAEEEMINLENNSSEWLDLFEEANKLITEIRTSAPEK